MAHIPLIHGPDGSKLSKRHGALGVDAYRAMGYLPAAMRNYLVRLGWSHGDQEIFSTEEMIAAFDLPQIGRSPARFDFAKLESLNGHYMRSSPDRDLLAAIDGLLPHLPNGAEIAGKLTPAVREQVMAAMPELKERAKTLVELIDARKLHLGGPAAGAGRQGGGAADARSARAACARSSRTWKRSSPGPRRRRNRRCAAMPNARAPSSARSRNRCGRP